MPTPRRCSGCGAALGDPTDDDLTIVCRFCGLRHDINDLAAEATPVVVQLGAPRPGGAARAIATIVLLVVALTVVTQSAWPTWQATDATTNTAPPVGAVTVMVGVTFFCVTTRGCEVAVGPP